MNGSLSDSEFRTCGIPQGTILGPLLFILYINNLPNCLSNAFARMYADDTHLTFACNNIETINDVMNHDLSNVNKWLVANKLTLNSSKTEFMLVGSQGWRSGESTHHPPMWPGFDSHTRRHMWVEFVGSLLCTERSSLDTPVSPLLKNQHLT